MNVACIGAGYFAEYHVEAWLRMPEISEVFICDQDIKKAELLAKKFGIKRIFSHTDDLFSRIPVDLIDIITPPDTHFSLISALSPKCKTIICQKPLAPTLEESVRIVKLAEKNSCQLLIHENFRFQPWHQKIKEIITDNVIGTQLHTMELNVSLGDGWAEDAYLKRQPYFRQMPRFFIYETGIHYIDVFRFLAGEIKSVFTRLKRLNQDIKGEDFAILIFEFENGTIGLLHANRYNEAASGDPRYTFGEMRVDATGGTIWLNNQGNILLKHLGREPQTIDYVHQNLNFAGDCVYVTQRHILEQILGINKYHNSGFNYLRNIAVQEAAYLSADTGVPVEVNYTMLNEL